MSHTSPATVGRTQGFGSSVDGVIREVEQLAPQLRDSAAETEAARRVLDQNLESLEGAKLFRLTKPESFGGFEGDLNAVYSVLRTIARSCPSTAWVCSIYLAATWWGALFDDQAQAEVYEDPDARFAGVLAPTAKARRVDGGAVISGRWSWNTGCVHADWGAMAGFMEGEDGPPCVFLIPYSEMDVIDDWNAMGMTGTGSSTSVAEEVFVPDRRIMPVPELIAGKYPDAATRRKTYFQQPAIPFFIASQGGMLVGTAEGAMEAFMRRLPGRAITYTEYDDQSQAPITHLQVGSAELEIEAARHFAERANEIVIEHEGAEMPSLERIKVRTFSGESARHARAAVETLFQASGASAIAMSVPIQRYHRDIQAITNHGLIQPTTLHELYGRVLCGLPPNTRHV